MVLAIWQVTFLVLFYYIGPVCLWDWVTVIGAIVAETVAGVEIVGTGSGSLGEEGEIGYESACWDCDCIFGDFVVVGA